MTDAPAPAPADGLRAHSAALRSHAERLRRAAGDLRWQGPRADALRAEVAGLADRCATAAGGFDLAAAQLAEPRPPGPPGTPGTPGTP